MQRRAIRTAVLLVAILSCFLTGVFWFLTRPATVEFAMGWLLRKSQWEGTIDHFKFHPLRARFTAQGISLRHRTFGGTLTVDEVDLTFHRMSLLRGKALIDDLMMNGVRGTFPKHEKTQHTKQRKRINIKQLLLFQNLEIDNAHIRHVSIELEQHALSADGLAFSLEHSFFGETSVAITAENASLKKGEETILSAGALSTHAQTTLEKWSAAFPYINNLSGKVEVKNGNAQGLSLDAISAELSLSDEHIALQPLEIVVSGASLQGTMDANLTSEAVVVSLDIPQPISLPHMGKESQTVDTGGLLSGHIEFSGTGLQFLAMQGVGKLALTHRFHASPTRDHTLTATLQLDAGTITTHDGHLTSGDGTADIDGFINIPKRDMRFVVTGESFPLEAVFEIFRDEHLKRIAGATNFSGSIEGWGKKFLATVEADTTHGGWLPIRTEEVVSHLQASYDHLHLEGTLLQKKNEVGSANFDILFGDRLADGNRRKTITLTGALQNYVFDASLLETAGLSGTGTGTITLSGESTHPKGEATVSLVNGQWYALPFEEASGKLEITKQKIMFYDFFLKPSRVVEHRFPDPFVLTFDDASMRLAGTPLPGLSLDIARNHSTKTWNIKTASFTSPTLPSEFVAVTGTVAPDGKINLRIKGNHDVGFLKTFASHFRDAGGSSTFDIAVAGTTDDPSFDGAITMTGNTLSFRTSPLPLEGVKGILRLKGHRIDFDNVTGRIEDGSFTLEGSLTHHEKNIASTDLFIETTSLPFRSPDGALRLEVNGVLSLRGDMPSPLLTGTMTLLDGRYTKDFTLLDALAEEREALQREQADDATAPFNPRLALHITNSGDLFIDNNIGLIGLKMDIEASGSRFAPNALGTVDVTEGEIHYLGLDFDISKGFIEFRGTLATPSLEVTAHKEVGVYHITLVLHGPTDNLSLDLSATSPSGPLEKRDVISLIAFGMTESEREQVASSQQGQLTSQIIASQVTRVVERPVSEFAHLDVFRLEAAEPGSQSISRVYIGKQISDRLSVDFSTDINTENAEQTVSSEYLLTDYLLVKAKRSSDREYGFEVTVRFRSR